MKFLVALALVVGIAIGVWYGHCVWRRPIVMAVDTYNKVIPHLEPGDHLVWTDQTANPSMHPVSVDFKHGNGKLLCEPSGGDPNKNIHECVVRAEVGKTPFAYYTYDCRPATACTDPDAGGGSDSGVLQGQGQGQQGQSQTASIASVSVAAVSLSTLDVYCDPSAMADAATTAPGQQLRWRPEASAGTSFSVGSATATGSLAPVCGAGNSIYNDGTVCTVAPQTPGTTVTTTYTVTTQACGTGSAQITVIAPPAAMPAAKR